MNQKNFNPNDLSVVFSINQLKENGQCLCSLEIPNLKREISEDNLPDFILIIDTSSSMEEVLPLIINQALPIGLGILGYRRKKIEIITFSGNASSFNKEVKQLKSLKMKCGGGSKFEGVFTKLEEVINSLEPNTTKRILTITDGMISDRVLSFKKSEEFVKVIKNRNINIISRVCQIEREEEGDKNESSDLDSGMLKMMSGLTTGKNIQDKMYKLNTKKSPNILGSTIAGFFRSSNKNTNQFDRVVIEGKILDKLQGEKPEKLYLNDGVFEFLLNFSEFNSMKDKIIISFPGSEGQQAKKVKPNKISYQIGDTINSDNYRQFINEDLYQEEMDKMNNHGKKPKKTVLTEKDKGKNKETAKDNAKSKNKPDNKPDNKLDNDEGMDYLFGNCREGQVENKKDEEGKKNENSPEGLNESEYVIKYVEKANNNLYKDEDTRKNILLQFDKIKEEAKHAEEYIDAVYKINEKKKKGNQKLNNQLNKKTIIFNNMEERYVKVAKLFKEKINNNRVKLLKEIEGELKGIENKIFEFSDWIVTYGWLNNSFLVDSEDEKNVKGYLFGMDENAKNMLNIMQETFDMHNANK